SLIPRAQVEGPSPITSVTAEDMEKQGFTNVFDALRSLPQSNGSVQDSQGTGNYTPGAKTISLFGLDPSYTLTLLNGRPMSSYPLAYNGNTSIVDIANIPMGMVERVDVLTGGQSSVYGSAAIAGVVNIVLKDHVEGTHFKYRVGGYSDGGGSNQRFQFSSGAQLGNLDISYGLQYEKQKPIYGFDRDYLDSATDSPSADPVDPSRTFLKQDLTAGATRYIDPGAATCAPLSNLFGGTNAYSYRDLSTGGYYCGSYDNVGYASLLNEAENVNGAVFARYHITPQTEFYADVLLSYGKPVYTGGLPSWNQSFYNQTTGRYELWQRIFAPEEVGIHAKDQRVFTRSYNIATGVRGPLGDSGFDYDVYLSRSGSSAIRKATDFLAANGVDEYYLGPQLGEMGGYPVYAPGADLLYQPITADQYYRWSATNRAKSTAWNQSATALLTNTSLFELPAGPVGFAGIVQTTREHFSNRSSAPGSENIFRGNGGATVAQGERDLYAAGLEFQVPVTSMFNVNLSGRYDKYALQGGGGNGKFTWKSGLEFRPLDNLLLRGSYATAFRSPDMYYLYASESSGFSSATDFYRCRAAGYGSSNYDDCPQADGSIRRFATGNRDLRDITAKTFTYGVVWSTLENALTLSLDFNSIEIENEVELMGTTDILELEANCRLGVSDNGQTAYDINSPTCRDALAQVTRRPADDPVDPNGIQEVLSYPVNLSKQRQTGLQGSAQYRWDAGSAGNFNFELGHYRALKHTRQFQEGDPVEDLLCCNNSNELYNRTTATVTWNRGPLGATVYGIRNAPTWNQAGTRRDIGPWTTFNGSVSYRFSELWGLMFSVNNIANKRPPRDATNGGWPYYDSGIYNAYGRSMQLELSVDL
ncbi:MAG TPA: TonB-dependent receptor, partial [Xanthomonadaceae bacterium]|nr:TonB-dependent receptor [Xanthomonadaceae bacterium]